MTGIRFAAVILVLLLGLFCLKKKKINAYLDSSVYYYCWAIMLVSNLGFPSSIQYATRILGIAISWFFLLFQSKGRLLLKKVMPGELLLIYLIICGLSTVWSVSLLQTLVKSVELFTDLILIWTLYTFEDPKQFVIKILNVMVVVFGVLLAVTLVGFIVWPSYFADTGTMASRSALGIRLGAGLLGANKSSALAAICVAWCLLINYEKKWSVYLLLALCAIVMWFSQSRASLAMIPVILLFKLHKPKDKYKLLYIGLIIVGIALVITNFNTLYVYLLRGQTVEQLQGGTGRVNIWHAAISYINKKPILGYGFGSGGELVAKNLYGIATMHSAIYETLLGTGCVGLFLLCTQYMYVAIRVVKNTLKYGVKNNLFDLFLLIYFLIRSLTSVGIGNWHSQEVMLWYYFMFAVSRSSIQMVYKNEVYG